MKAVNFTTISRQLNTTHSAHVDPYFCGSCPCTNSIKYTRFQDVRELMDVFMSVVKVCMGLELCEHVQVAIIFLHCVENKVGIKQ